MKRRVALAVAIAALAGAPAARAQGTTIQAVDGTPADQFNNRWSPKDVTINPGETVTWSFAGTTGFHNVQSNGSNWTPPFRSGNAGQAPPPASYTFTTAGRYEFICEVHATTMTGTVTVGNPPPPPPPPLSEQPFANDQTAPSVFEVADEKRPRLDRVRVRSVRGGARVRFRVSERSRVHVRFKLGGLTVKSARRTFRAGTHRLTVRDRRMRGRYRVDVFARDLAGNRSRVRHARLTIR
jgi:plastocyanin